MDNKKSIQYETVKIPKTDAVCPICEDYAKDNADKSVMVICCEGACLRGEIARQAANLLCHKLAPKKTARICLGGAFTKDGCQRDLVRNGKNVLSLEGCFIECASRTMKGVIPDLEAKIVIADELYEFDRALFGINEMPEEQIKKHAMEVAEKVLEMLDK